MSAPKAEDIAVGKTVYFAGKKIRGTKAAAAKPVTASPPVKSEKSDSKPGKSGNG